MNNQKPQHVELIREVFAYSRRFRGKCFVIQLASELFEEQSIPSIVSDLALLQHSGIRILVVPGARLRINDVLHRFKKESAFKKGLRISESEALPLITMAAFDVANQIMTEFSRQGLDSVIGNWVRARSLGVLDGTDFHRTGSVEKIHKEQLENILNDGIIPILPCIGWNSTGQAYNVSSLELAQCLAVSMKAEKLFYLCDSFFLDADVLRSASDSVSRSASHRNINTAKPSQHQTNNKAQSNSAKRGNQLTSIHAQDVAGFLKNNKDTLDADSYEIIERSAHASLNGVRRAHILNARIDGAVLQEIFSVQGSGTMIHNTPFNAIRPMKSEDIANVMRLCEPEVKKGNLVERSASDLLKALNDYVVYDVDGAIRGSAALHCYEGDLAELASVVVHAGSVNTGIGNKLVSYLLKRAEELRVRRVFALTTAASDWFLKLGFAQCDPSELPQDRQYSNIRNSRVYCLSINAGT